MPASISFPIISGLRDARPKVQTIFVLRIRILFLIIIFCADSILNLDSVFVNYFLGIGRCLFAFTIDRGYNKCLTLTWCKGVSYRVVVFARRERALGYPRAPERLNIPGGGPRAYLESFYTRHFGKFHCLFALSSLPGASPPASSAPKIQQNYARKRGYKKTPNRL
jgi:hypothetical protein